MTDRSIILRFSEIIQAAIGNRAIFSAHASQNLVIICEYSPDIRGRDWRSCDLKAVARFKRIEAKMDS